MRCLPERAVLVPFLLASLLLLGACGAETDSREVELPETWEGLSAAAAPFEGATLRILGEDLPPLHSLNRLKDRFTEATGIEVEVDFKNHSKVIQSILEGALRQDYQYDIIFVPHKEMGRLVETESVFPMERFASRAGLRDPEFQPREQFFQPFWTEVTSYRDTWYSMPLYLGGSVVVYRKDLVESEEEKERFARRYDGAELSEPETLEEWMRLAEYFYRPDRDPPLYGITLLMSDESLWYNWQSVLFALGGNVIDAEHGWEYGPVVVDSPQAVEATEVYERMAGYAPPDASSYSWGLGIAKQQAGVSFMTLLQYDVVAEFEDPEKTELAGNFGYFIPRTPDGGCASQLESWVGYIPVSSPAPEAAWLLLQWMMQEDVQLQMHLEGNVSPRRSTYEDPRVQEMAATPAILESLGCMTPKPTFPEAAAVQDILTRRLQSVLRDEQSAEEALAQAAREISRRLGDEVGVHGEG